VKLVLEHPFPGDDIGTSRTRDQCPSAIIKNSVEFILHSCMPVGVSQGIVIIYQNR
jgi:hypothetical protein